MSKQKINYQCTECGHGQTKWAGQCAGCGVWNTLQEVAQVSQVKAAIVALLVSQIIRVREIIRVTH